MMTAERRTTAGADASLDLALEVWKIAVASHLRAGLHEPGCDGRAIDAPASVDAVIAGIGRRTEPGAQERADVRAAFDALDRQGTGALPAFRQALGLTPADQLLVGAAWWYEADAGFAAALERIEGARATRGLTVLRLRTLAAPFGIEITPALDNVHALVVGGVVGAAADGVIALTPTARLALAGRIVAARVEWGDLPRRLDGERRALAARLAQTARLGDERSEPSVTVLRGPAGSNRRALAAAAAADAQLFAVGGDRPIDELRLLARLGVAVPVLTADEAGDADAHWTADDGALIVIAPPGHRSSAPRAMVVDLPLPTTPERTAHWDHSLQAVGVRPRRGGRAPTPGTLAGELAERLLHAEPAIDETVARARRNAAWESRPVTPDDVWAAARRQPEVDLERLATLVEPVSTLDDLVVSHRVREQLRDLLAHVTQRDLVLEQWGFARRLPRGRGVAVLFAGPSGTGKTMAAEALAHTLHLDLYRIDLSAVVSKWIGETEKNLAVAFDEAERSGAVLFFDEADALFGKRTEVRDGRDRYANLEVNYLLQRVELFTGLVILATNRRAALDEAFTRRLRFIVSFEMPTRADRRELWRRSFPSEAQRVDLDWDVLAEGELAGASIQNVALSAAFLAAADGGLITHSHIERALEREYEKLGKAFTGLRAESST